VSNTFRTHDTPATDLDSALVLVSVLKAGSQIAVQRATGVPQHRLSRARESGVGRALSQTMRDKLQEFIK
jgi:hypothetical protein